MASSTVLASPKRRKCSEKQPVLGKCDQNHKISDRLNPKTVNPVRVFFIY